MAGWHHGLAGRESEWTPGDGDEQGGLACCNSWCHKESDTNERLKWSELNWTESQWLVLVTLKQTLLLILLKSHNAFPQCSAFPLSHNFSLSSILLFYLSYHLVTFFKLLLLWNTMNSNLPICSKSFYVLCAKVWWGSLNYQFLAMTLKALMDYDRCETYAQILT